MKTPIAFQINNCEQEWVYYNMFALYRVSRFNLYNLKFSLFAQTHPCSFFLKYVVFRNQLFKNIERFGG